MMDLLLLSADKNIDAGVSEVLKRFQAMGCRAFSFKALIHPHRDPGCYGRSAEFLRPFAKQYSRALVVFDREGSGADADRTSIETAVESRLSLAGWDGRCVAIVVDPEIENWVWSDSPNVPAALGWSRDVALRDWLRSEGFWPTGVPKPARPKEALEYVLREMRLPRSSALYSHLAASVSFGRCIDPAFDKLRTTLRAWFPSA